MAGLLANRRGVFGSHLGHTCLPCAAQRAARPSRSSKAAASGGWGGRRRAQSLPNNSISFAAKASQEMAPIGRP